MYIKYFSIMLKQNLGSQQLHRTPEPTSISNQTNQVGEYNQALSTSLSLVYILLIETLNRLVVKTSRELKIIDVACGPGLFSLLLAENFGGKADLLGIDLAPNMIEIARENARLNNQSHQVKFDVNDATQLKSIPDQFFDITCFNDAAHQIPDVEKLQLVFLELERITKKDGVIVVGDLRRLRTARLTDEMVNLVGSDYKERGLSTFLNDYRNSLYAAWTPDELRSALNPSSRQNWIHLPGGPLPTYQMLIRPPISSRSLFVRPHQPFDKNPIAVKLYQHWIEEMGKDWADQKKKDYLMLRWAFFLQHSVVDTTYSAIESEIKF